MYDHCMTKNKIKASFSGLLFSLGIITTRKLTLLFQPLSSFPTYIKGDAPLSNNRSPNTNLIFRKLRVGVMVPFKNK